MIPEGVSPAEENAVLVAQRATRTSDRRSYFTQFVEVIHELKGEPFLAYFIEAHRDFNQRVAPDENKVWRPYPFCSSR